MSNNVEGLHDITLFASNLSELRDFYTKLGFRQVVDQGEELVVFEVGDNELAIHSSPDRPQGSVGLTFLVLNIATIEARLRELGIAFRGPQRVRPGLSGITLHDPNGNTLAFLQEN